MFDDDEIDEDTLDVRIDDLRLLILETQKLIKKRTDEIMYEPTPINRCNMTDADKFDIKLWFTEIRDFIIGSVKVNIGLITINLILHLAAMWFMLDHFLG